MPALATPNFDTLRPPGNPDDFVLVERPVFSEHWTKEVRDKTGKVIAEATYIGPRELAVIANRCNERILDTNDFSPIVIQHNSDQFSIDPELIGYGGPFYMGTVGNLKPKAAIYAKTWVYKDKQSKMRQYPRLSVEYWCSPDDPGNGYFDPISLLGARTPELDLGLHYAATEGSDKRLIRYSQTQAAFPGGSNTSPPALIGDDEPDKRDYSKGSGGMLTAEDIQQIVAAMAQAIDQKIDERMAEMKSLMGVDKPTDADGLDLEGDEDLDIDEGLEGLDDELPDDQGDDADLDLDEDLPPEIADEDAADAGDETEQADGDVADSDVEPETPEPSGEDEEGDPMASAAPPKKPDEKDKPQRFEKQRGEMTLQQYAKENRDLRMQYEKAETRARAAEERLAGLETRLTSIEGDKVRAVRYSKLADLRTEGYVVDIDAELTDAKDMTDAQFDRHCTKIVQHYQRAPIGHSIPIPASEKRDGVPRDEVRTQYSKTARAVCEEAVKKNKPLDYGTVLANVERNKGEYKPAA